MEAAAVGSHGNQRQELNALRRQLAQPAVTEALELLNGIVNDDGWRKAHVGHVWMRLELSITPESLNEWRELVKLALAARPTPNEEESDETK